jgi:peptide deformylase
VIPRARSLVLYGDPVLKQRAEPVTVFDDELAALVQDMYRIMYEERGIGLAGPQVGEPLRVFVVDVREDDESESVKLSVINPEIVDKRGAEVEEEGCLSLPGIREKVKRPERIVMVYRDEAGEEYEVEADGLIARALQHEYDHLDGILITDRIPAMRRALLKRQLADIAAGKVPKESERAE